MFIHTKDKLVEPEKVFLGQCLGVALFKRGPNDPHVLFEVIVEDDDNWFAHERSDGKYSSFWITDLEQVLREAEQWMKDNCINDGWGWSFKE